MNITKNIALAYNTNIPEALFLAEYEHFRNIALARELSFSVNIPGTFFY